MDGHLPPSLSLCAPGPGSTRPDIARGGPFRGPGPGWRCGPGTTPRKKAQPTATRGRSPDVPTWGRAKPRPPHAGLPSRPADWPRGRWVSPLLLGGGARGWPLHCASPVSGPHPPTCRQHATYLVPSAKSPTEIGLGLTHEVMSVRLFFTCGVFFIYSPNPLRLNFKRFSRAGVRRWPLATLWAGGLSWAEQCRGGRLVRGAGARATPGTGGSSAAGQWAAGGTDQLTSGPEPSGGAPSR